MNRERERSISKTNAVNKYFDQQNTKINTVAVPMYIDPNWNLMLFEISCSMYVAHRNDKRVTDVDS